MAVYYVDPKNGNHGNDGLSSLMPVCSCDDVDFKAGDTLLYKRGSFIRGRLNNKSGTKDKPIVYGAYGEGAAPTFCGSSDIGSRENWRELDRNIWVYENAASETANLIFNNSDKCGSLKWSVDELRQQGDFYDSFFGVYSQKKQPPEQHRLYMYSKGNPGDIYSAIECTTCGMRTLASNGENMIFDGLRFINNGIHAIAGEGKSRNIIIKNCVFEFIGGAVYDDVRKIRYGNAIEFWNVGENIEVSGCYFNNIYDSAITHQGCSKCMPADKLVIKDNVFIRCGMAAYEQRDRMPKNSVFENNICIDAGEGFSKNGMKMPRRSEIWPQPMGHHIFLWRINNPTKDGGLEIKNNIFYNAPYGAAIYSIASENAEKQVRLEDNTYYTENRENICRWNGKNYSDFKDYSRYDTNSRNIKLDIKALLNQWLTVHNMCG